MLVIGAFLVQTAVAPAPRPLGPPDASLAHEFVRVYSLWERPDGRIVVVDRGDELLAIADFARGTVTRIGRVGGPGAAKIQLLQHALPGRAPH